MAADQAIAALNAFITAWNSGDNTQLRATLNYPHITHTPNGLVIANTPEEFANDFAQLRSQGWARSTFDDFKVRQSSANKVNVEVLYSRYNAAGEVYSRGYVYYVVTNQNEHWGMQYRAPGAMPAALISQAESQARQDAERAVQRFFSAFNNADNVALLEVNHVPQLMLNNTTATYADNVASGIVSVNFTAMREREKWHRSEIENLQAVNVTPTQMIFELEFHRFRADGERYRSVPAVWVLRKIDDKWGIEFRSLMPATLDR